MHAAVAVDDPRDLGDRERYLEAYWRRFPGVWTHGDWASVDEDGEWFLHGRSDDTLNIAGKRIGPAEYESALVDDPSVAEACAVGVPDEVKGEAVGLLRGAHPGAEPSDELRTMLRERVAAALGRPVRARDIRFTEALPKTRSAKIVRRAVRAVTMGEDPGDVGTSRTPRPSRPWLRPSSPPPRRPGGRPTGGRSRRARSAPPPRRRGLGRPPCAALMATGAACSTG